MFDDADVTQPSPDDADAGGADTFAPDDATLATGEGERSQAEVPDDHAARDADGELHPFYCPGCGRGQRIEGMCNGSAEAPHPPIQTVSTDELSGDPDDHTPAPASE